jgi:hypothetical protein
LFASLPADFLGCQEWGDAWLESGESGWTDGCVLDNWIQLFVQWRKDWTKGLSERLKQESIVLVVDAHRSREAIETMRLFHQAKIMV